MQMKVDFAIASAKHACSRRREMIALRALNCLAACLGHGAEECTHQPQAPLSTRIRQAAQA
jgi:hypothetical protein